MKDVKGQKRYFYYSRINSGKNSKIENKDSFMEIYPKIIA